MLNTRQHVTIANSSAFPHSSQEALKAATPLCLSHKPHKHHTCGLQCCFKVADPPMRQMSSAIFLPASYARQHALRQLANNCRDGRQYQIQWTMCWWRWIQRLTAPGCRLPWRSSPTTSMPLTGSAQPWTPPRTGARLSNASSRACCSASLTPTSAPLALFKL